MSLSQSINYYFDLKEHLRRFYFFDEQKLRLIQNERFRSILGFACTNIPFYKNKFLEHKINLTKVQGLDQIKEFPFTEPDDYFSQPRYVRADAKKIYMTLRSSGTTGQPKDVYLSGFDRCHYRRLAYLRMFFSSGCSPFYKTLFLTSPPLSTNIKLKCFWKLGLMREKGICITRPRDEQVAIFNQFQPDVLYCFTADGIALADYMKRRMKQSHKAKYLFTTGEISTEKDRQTMIDNLGERVIDFYANTEVGIIAWQCSKTGAYHINADQVYAETVEGQRLCQDGEEGEVILTTLMPCCSPLIRYRTGDIAVLEHGRCVCGSSFPRLSQIMGRKNDFLTNTKGERISPYILMVTMDTFKEVEEYRICQDALTQYTLYFKLNNINTNKTIVESEIRRAYHKIFGEESRIAIVDLSQSSLHNKGYKRKTIISHVK